MAALENKNTILINIIIPDKNIERNLEWNLTETIESLKSYALKIVPDLEDPLNYGLFLPPSNGKNGKFLQEERILDHYSPNDSLKLELKKKVRLYHISINSPKIKKINSKSNQKQLVQYIRNGDVMKINKYLYDGIDPNFHIPGIPETPLSLACKLKDPHVIIMALANNGAYLDFRSTDSLTALHKTAIEGLCEPMKTLLQLGQSPNCKDIRGYTPLYYCIENDAPGECVELLLFEHSMMGIQDEHGLQEIHKACLYGRTKHLDYLISYGADIDAKTSKGNTALHVCAVHNQGACARLLLYRGITRHAVDDDNKSAYQTALLSNNLELADLIQNFRDEDVVPVTTLPKFNEKRRSIIPSMKRFSSLGRLSNGTEDFNRDSQTISSDERISFYGSVSSLPQGINSTPSTPHKYPNNTSKYSDPSDCQSLHNFPNSKPKDHLPHLNTWTSSADNTKVNIKARLPIASILNSKMENIPRVVVLQKGFAGFGFILRGSKTDNQAEFIAKPSMPATHYFEGIAENSPSESAGLLSGDFLLEVNNIDVHKMTHGEVVRIIKMAGEHLTMKVITVNHSTASNGLFDGCSDEKSCHDSISIVSDNSSSAGTYQSNIVIEGKSDSKETLKVTNVKSNQIIRQNMSPLFPTESKEDDFIKQKLKANSQNNKRNVNNQDNNKVIKAQAPPPPIRADNTQEAIPQRSNDNRLKAFDDRDSKSEFYFSGSRLTPNEVSSNKSIDHPATISTDSSKSSSKIYIPPVDYNSDTEADNHSQHNNDNSVKTSTVPISNLPVLFYPPPPPPPPPPILPPPTQSAETAKNQHYQNLDKEISAVCLKPVSNNVKDHPVEDNSANLSSHDKALRDAILNFRKKVECGETVPANIEGKLKETKVGNKSIVFEANSPLVQNLDSSKPTTPVPPSINKIDSTKKIPPSVPTKTPVVKPKPGAQNFFTAVESKQPPAAQLSPNSNDTSTKVQESNLKLKAEKLRSDLVKQEQQSKKGTLYFTSAK